MTTLGSLLVQNRIVGVVDIEKALQRQVIAGGDPATVMLELKLVEENTLTKYAAEALGMTSLERAFIDTPNESVVKKMSRSVAEKYRVVPVRIDGDKIILAASSPVDFQVISELESILGKEVSPRFVLEFRLEMLLNRCFGISMSKRFIKLKDRLAPNFTVDAPPIVTSSEKLQASADTNQSQSVEELPIESSLHKENMQVPQAAGLSEKKATSVSLVNAARMSIIPGGLGVSSVAPESEPLNIADIKEQLLQCAQRDEIIDIFMRAAGDVFNFAVLFVIQGTDAVAHSIIDGKGNITRTSSPLVPLDIGGMFQTSFTTGSFYLGPPGNTTEDEMILQELNRERPKNCAILPVTLRGRIVLMLYGDCGLLGVNGERMSDLTQLARLIAESLERLLLEKKYGKYQAASYLPSIPARRMFSGAPPRLSEDEGSAELYRSADSAIDSDQYGKLAGKFRSELGEEKTASDDNISPSVPMASVKLSNKEEKPPALLVLDEKSQRIETDNVKYDSPIEMDKSEYKDELEDSEIDTLISLMLDSAKEFDSSSLKSLQTAGDRALKKLVKFFPGPLTCDRYREADRLPRADRHGPLLKALIAFGENAAPHIIPLLDSLDTDVRFYSTFLFSEIRSFGAVESLSRRLFDSDRSIRGIAADVMSEYSGSDEYNQAIDYIVEMLNSSSRDLEMKRNAASALGNLGEPKGVSYLISMLDSVDEHLVRAVRRALIKITFFDHGLAVRRWSEWYEIFQHRNREEWAVEGLTNEEETIRRSAWLYLAPKVKDMTDIAPDGPVTMRDYKEIQDLLKRRRREEGRGVNRFSTGK